MKQVLHSLAIVVHDYDEAIAFYTQKLGFDLLEDTPLDGDKRWVAVAPAGAGKEGAALVLARAANPQQENRVGDQTGGRVFLFLHTDDFWRDYETYRARGVEFEETPRSEPHGVVAVFRDLYGNRWDLIQRRAERVE